MYLLYSIGESMSNAVPSSPPLLGTSRSSDLGRVQTASDLVSLYHMLVGSCADWRRVRERLLFCQNHFHGLDNFVSLQFRYAKQFVVESASEVRTIVLTECRRHEKG